MSESTEVLRDLVRQLKTELEWASRTGIEVAPPRPRPAQSDAPAQPSAAASSGPHPGAGSGPHPGAGSGPHPGAGSGPHPGAPMAPPSQARPGEPRTAPQPDLRGSRAPEAPARRQDGPPMPEPPPYLDDVPPPFDARPQSSPPQASPRAHAPRVQGGQRADAPKPPAYRFSHWTPTDRPSLSVIREDLGECTRCKLSGLGRKHIVFGVGNPNADLMFVGEGPGADEDRTGVPFVGKAGQLLTKIIEGMGFARSEVYIANIVKCRPPKNRDPESDEIETCIPFLKGQIAAVRPKVLVALGRPASQSLLQTSAPISRLRGKWAEFEGIPLMPTFHPAYVLRNPAGKRPVWDDMKAVLAKMGRDLPQRRR